MIRSLAITILCLAAISAAERLPSDCRWALHLDAQAVLASPAGAWLRGLAAAPMVAARIRLAELAAGSTIERDLRSITIAGSDTGEAGRVVLVRARFDPDRLGVLVDALPGHRVVEAGQRQIHDFGKFAACLASPDLLVIASRPARVESALAAIDGTAAPAALPWPATWDDPALATLSVLSPGEWGDGGLRERPFAGVRSLATRLTTFGDALAIEATGEAGGQDDALQIVEIGRQALAAEHGSPEMNACCRNATIGNTEERLELRMVMPSDDLRRLLGRIGQRPAAPPPAERPF